MRSLTARPWRGVEAQRRRRPGRRSSVCSTSRARLLDGDAHDVGPPPCRGDVVGGLLVDLASGCGEQRARRGERGGGPTARRARVRVVAPGGVLGEVAPDASGDAVPARGDADAAVPEARPARRSARWPPTWASRGDVDVDARRARVAGPHPDRVPVVGEPQRGHVDVEEPDGAVRIGRRHERSVDRRRRRSTTACARRAASPSPSGAARSCSGRAAHTPRRASARVVGRAELVEDRQRVEVALGEAGQRAVGGAELGERPPALHGEAGTRGRDPAEAREVIAQPRASGPPDRRRRTGHHPRARCSATRSTTAVRDQEPSTGTRHVRDSPVWPVASAVSESRACRAGRRSPAPSSGPDRSTRRRCAPRRHGRRRSRPSLVAVPARDEVATGAGLPALDRPGRGPPCRTSTSSPSSPPTRCRDDTAERRPHHADGAHSHRRRRGHVARPGRGPRRRRHALASRRAGATSLRRVDRQHRRRLRRRRRLAGRAAPVTPPRARDATAGIVRLDPAAPARLRAEFAAVLRRRRAARTATSTPPTSASGRAPTSPSTAGRRMPWSARTTTCGGGCGAAGHAIAASRRRRRHDVGADPQPGDRRVRVGAGPSRRTLAPTGRALRLTAAITRIRTLPRTPAGGARAAAAAGRSRGAAGG